MEMKPVTESIETERQLCTRRKSVDIFLGPLSQQLRVVAEMEVTEEKLRALYPGISNAQIFKAFIEPGMAL
ncbi:MAG: hypothetical protein AB7Y74_15630 [Syntrophorhabdus sp.]